MKKQHINSELKTAWIRQLRDDWRNANYIFFKNKMVTPNIDLVESGNLLGNWKGGVYRTISISASLIQNHPWEYVQEVLFHEMAHQYVDEVLWIRDAAPHGEAFKRICLENSIDSSAGGELESWVKNRKNSGKALPENHKILDKVHKLLALAQSGNQNEAQAAMEKAHELLLKHNLSLLDTGANGHYIHKQIGEIGRKNPIKSLIANIIAKFFFVETIWVFGYEPFKDKKGRVLEIYGTPENVEMAQYVYDYLQNISELLWFDYKKRNGVGGNQHRRTFIYGLLNGFFNKLDSRVVRNQSTSLVWKGDPKLKDYYHRRNPKIVHSPFRYSRSCQDAYHSGMDKGKSLVIHKGIHGRNANKKCLLN